VETNSGQPILLCGHRKPEEDRIDREGQEPGPADRRKWDGKYGSSVLLDRVYLSVTMPVSGLGMKSGVERLG
jgi:hypothetical protein